MQRNGPKKRRSSWFEAEETSSERRESDEEISASQFAGDVMLGGKANELAEDCLAQASNMIPRLQRVVRRVAKKQGVSVGALANYLAFRLSSARRQLVGRGCQPSARGRRPLDRRTRRLLLSDILTVSKVRLIALCLIAP